MVASLQQTPTNTDWEKLRVIGKMEPEEFLQKWNVTYLEMAQVCRVSENTVKRWFATGSKDYRAPKESHKALLAFTDREWSRRSYDDAAEIYQWEIYNRAKGRPPKPDKPAE